MSEEYQAIVESAQLFIPAFELDADGQCHDTLLRQAGLLVVQLGALVRVYPNRPVLNFTGRRQTDGVRVDIIRPNNMGPAFLKTDDVNLRQLDQESEITEE